MLPAFGAAAEDWPTRPIRALTTTSAGGISDVFMRALGEKLRERLGQPIVVENRPGGAQMVGARACQDSAPDGYTICIVNSDAMIYNQFLFKWIQVGCHNLIGLSKPGIFNENVIILK